MDMKNRNHVTSELAFGHVVVTNYVLAHLIVHLGLGDKVKSLLSDPGFIIEVESINLNEEIEEGKSDLLNSIDSVPTTTT